MTTLAVPHFWIPKRDLVLPDWRRGISRIKGQFGRGQSIQFDEDLGVMTHGAGGITALTFAFLASETFETARTSHTISDASLGAAPGAGERRFICTVNISEKSGTDNLDVDTLTVDGVTGNEIIETNQSTGASRVSTIWMHEIPTVTSGDIVVTYTGEVDRGAISWFRIIGGTDFAGVATDTDFAEGSSVSSLTTPSMDAVENGITVAAICWASDSRTSAWSGTLGVTDDDEEYEDGSVDASMGAAVAIHSFGADTSGTVVCTPSSSASGALSVASFGPTT